MRLDSPLNSSARIAIDLWRCRAKVPSPGSHKASFLFFFLRVQISNRTLHFNQKDELLPRTSCQDPVKDPKTLAAAVAAPPLPCVSVHAFILSQNVL